VTELAPFAPQAAAELATGALALTLPSDPGLPARTAAAVRALTAAGQWGEAETLVRSALAVPLPAREGAALRCALASLLTLTGRAAEAMTEAQTVLTNSDVPADLRDDATVALLWAWLGLRGNRQVDRLAGTILAEPSTKRGAIVVAAMVALGVARWDSGRITEALDLAAQAVRQATERPYETTYFSPHLLLASALVYVRRLDEATAITNSVESLEGAVMSPWPEGTTEILRARIALAAGRDDEAIRCLQEALVEYGRLGARRSVAHTRRRLRQLGVRRRHWASERRLTGGWAGLTDIEQATARLVAEGLTNQQIADQLFISTHTVAFHLRQMFRKLDISSRVDLARIALEHARPGDGETPLMGDVSRPAQRRGCPSDGVCWLRHDAHPVQPDPRTRGSWPGTSDTS
jgi:DNA-binding CsgD family transcriptional regulator